MKLWLIQPRPDLPRDNPWDPWYDKPFGAVIRAETEQQAREIAAEEVRGNRFGEFPAWLDSQMSDCVELTAEGEPSVIIEDAHWA